VHAGPQPTIRLAAEGPFKSRFRFCSPLEREVVVCVYIYIYIKHNTTYMYIYIYIYICISSTTQRICICIYIRHNTTYMKQGKNATLPPPPSSSYLYVPSSRKMDAPTLERLKMALGEMTTTTTDDKNEVLCDQE
jgi:hypothetical protein